MAFTSEAIPVPIGTQTNQPNQFNLESKTFVGYDPKGTTSVTGSNLADNPKVQPQTSSPTEKQVEPVAETPAEEVALSPKLSAIARKEQAQRAREKLLSDREKLLEEKLKKAEKFEQLEAKLAAKDYSAVDELGINYEEVVKHELNKEASKDPSQERIRKLEEDQAKLTKALEEKEVKEYQANQALWKNEIVRVIKENDEFSTVRELEAEEIVLQHINDSFEEDNVELTVEQAAKDIEEALLQRAEKFSSVSKIKNKASDGKVLGPPKTSVKTITQNMTTTPKTAPMSKPFHLMSESEQIAEAIRRVQAAKLQR